MFRSVLLALFPACFISRGRGLTFVFARVLVRAHVDGPSSQSTTHWTTHRVYPVLWCPLWPCFHHMCVIAKETVTIGSHMQQDIDIAKALPHLGAPIPLFEHRSRLKTTIQKIGQRVFAAMLGGVLKGGNYRRN